LGTGHAAGLGHLVINVGSGKGLLGGVAAAAAAAAAAADNSLGGRVEARVNLV